MPPKDGTPSATVLFPFNKIFFLAYTEFKAYMDKATPKQMEDFLSSFHNRGFHMLLDQDDTPDLREKIKYTCTHARRLGIDPNALIKTTADFPAHLNWNNTPLHHCISYEKLSLIPLFLEHIKNAGFLVNLNIRDNEGKTPLMFALKLGWAPIEVIRLLITLENYNMPDKAGFTPLMVACALRQVETVKLLIQYEANRLNLGTIDFLNMTSHQRSMLSNFIHAVHPESGKTLAHFAVLRLGRLADQQKEMSYQETVLNILKAAGVDGFRDENARWNSITPPDRQILPIQGSKAVPTHISYSNVTNYSGRVYLNSRANQQNILALPLGALRPVLTQLFATHSGRSLGNAILSRSLQMLELLQNIGCDCSLPQKNGKTPLSYVEGLMQPSVTSLISKEDEAYLFPLKTQLNILEERVKTEKRNYIFSFFAEKSIVHPQEILAYCDVGPH